MNTKIEFEIYKCGCLIKALIKRNQSPDLALQNYSKSVYESAIKELNEVKNG